MPPLPNQPNILKVRYLQTVGTDTAAVNILHLQYAGGPPTATDLATIAGQLYTSFVTNAIPMMGADRAINEIEITDLTTPTSARGVHTATTSGSRVGGPLPASTCALFPLGIVRRYRGGKPRIYWPWGVDSDLLNASSWGSTFATAAQAAMQAMRNDFLAAASGTTTITAWVSISQYAGFTAVQNVITGRWRNVPKPRTVAIAPDNINTFHLDLKPASQRRRAQQRV